MRSSKGFSLIELMVVVGIIGVLILIAQPVYSSYLIRIRYTQLIKHALEVSKEIELAAADSGGNGLHNISFLLSIASTFCMPESGGNVVHEGGNINRVHCTPNRLLLVPPENTWPRSFALVSSFELSTFENYGNPVFSMTSHFMSPDGKSNYILTYSAANNRVRMRITMIGREGGKDIQALYGGQSGKEIRRVMILQKGYDFSGTVETDSGVTLYDRDLNKKQLSSGWTCGFDDLTTVVSTSPLTLPLASEMPTICRSLGNGKYSAAPEDIDFYEI